MLPKVSPARLTYLPQVGQLASKDRRTSWEFPKDQARPHTRFQRVRKIRPSTSPTPPKGHLLMFLSRGLTCYTDVESNGRDAPYQNPNRCQMCDLEETRMHAQMTVSPSPHAPKVSPARFDIPLQVDNSQDRRTSCSP
jgi:hypothetical protein